jgi:hypothetical protein
VSSLLVVSIEAIAAAGALGGAADELGAEYRARVGALVATAVLRGTPLDDVGLAMNGGLPVLVHAETDDPVDDLVVHLASGGRVYIQAKHRLQLRDAAGSPLAAAVGQFVRAVQRGLGPDDRMVLAGAHVSEPLRRLGGYLDRRRMAAHGAPTDMEHTALERFVTIARRFASVEDVKRVLDRLVIWQTDPTQGDGLAALISRLEGHVVAPDTGARAVRELSDEIRHLARSRAGRDGLQLAQALAARGVPLLASGPSPVAWAAALSSYRARVVRRGTTLELFGAPPSLRHLRLRDADADIRVDRSDDDDSRLGWPMIPTLRRRGRVLLVGAPGGGKSTALMSAAAHWAARESWPVPVRVHLQRVASSSRAPVDGILDAAVEHLANGTEREALRGALAHELAAGRCLLLLDGFDEVRRGRRALAEDLSSLLRDMHEGVEVAIATRPVAADDARVLGLVELTLRAPERAMATVDAILDAAAPPTGTEPWLSERRHWVEQSLQRDAVLRRTPLTIVILAMIAAQAADTALLPRTRATILHRALRDVIDRWELERRQRGDVRIGPLTCTTAQQALTRALLVLSRAVLSERPVAVDTVTAEVTRALETDFGLASGAARAAGEDAVAFWTDTGIFAGDGDAVTANLRQFAELGNAWGPALEGDPNPERWIGEARSSADLWASLALAAGLEPSIGDLWGHAVAANGDVDELIALTDAVDDGAAISRPTLTSLATAAADRLLAQPADAERAAEALIALPLTAGARRQIRQRLVESVPAERRQLIDAMVIVRWDECGRDADERLRRFIAAPAPPFVPGSRDSDADAPRFFIPRSDDAYHETFAAAAIRIAQLSRADAEMVVDRFVQTREGTRAFRDALETTVRSKGHGDLAARVNEDLEELAARRATSWPSLEELRATERHLLEHVAALAPPAVLTQLQLRRLNELVDFYATAVLNWIPPGWELRHPATCKTWVQAVAALGDFDTGVLAAQAALVLEDLDGDDAAGHLLGDGGRRRELRHWSRVEQPEATIEAIADCLGRLPHQASNALLEAIGSSPVPEHAVSVLESELPTLRRWARTLAALILVVAAEQIPGSGRSIADGYARAWLSSEDAFLRHAAAEWWSYRFPSGQDALERCLSDPDAGVRRNAVIYLHRDAITPDLRARLETLRNEPPTGWVCVWCGEENDASARGGCARCSTSGPNVAEAIADVLELKSSPREFASLFAPSPRRVRRFAEPNLW